ARPRLGPQRPRRRTGSFGIHYSSEAGVIRHPRGLRPCSCRRLCGDVVRGLRLAIRFERVRALCLRLAREPVLRSRGLGGQPRDRVRWYGQLRSDRSRFEAKRERGHRLDRHSERLFGVGWERGGIRSVRRLGGFGLERDARHRLDRPAGADLSNGTGFRWNDPCRVRSNDRRRGPTPGQIEIWHASSANGWANSELILPDDAAPARIKRYPVLTIDSTNRSHVVWMEWNDNGNLYYANSTDWNRAIKITNASTNLGYAEQLPSHPVEVRNGRLTVVYSDARSGTPALWRKDDWDLGPDIAPPIAGPLPNRTIGLATGGRLQAAGSWDNDRIASYAWRFTGPSTVVASGYDVIVNLALTGRYAGVLEVRDPAGFSAMTNFTLDVVPEASTTGWILDRPLSSVPGSNNWVTVFPWDGTAFPVVFWGAIYLRMGMRGE